ncbi:MAG: aminopeptidase [Opitutus sp.]|nr:aminopeptidase [Opitutus sp.]
MAAHRVHAISRGMRVSVPAMLCVGLAAGALLADDQAGDQAVADQLRADVTALADGIGARSVMQGDTLARAERFVAGQLAKVGWKVERQVYLVDQTECANLVMEKKGRTKPEEIVVVGAHYDTVPQTPGADDNASGVAALLALARQFAGAEPDRTLRFVAFANEEPIHFQTQLMGSLVYAKACKARGDKITAMLSLETMGYFRDDRGTQKYPFPLSLFYPSRGNFVAVVGDRDSRDLVKRVTKSIRATKAIRCESASLPGGIQGVGWSDHWSFWQAGYRAVMITDTAPFRNPHYHRATDTPDTLDYEKLAAIVRALRAAIDDLVKAPQERT